MGLKVAVAGGALTVKDPALRLRGIPFPSGSLAVAFTSPRSKVPGAAPVRTLKVIVATVPSGMAVWLIPKIRIRRVEASG